MSCPDLWECHRLGSTRNPLRAFARRERIATGTARILSDRRTWWQRDDQAFTSSRVRSMCGARDRGGHRFFNGAGDVHHRKSAEAPGPHNADFSSMRRRAARPARGPTTWPWLQVGSRFQAAASVAEAYVQFRLAVNVIFSYDTYF